MVDTSSSFKLQLIRGDITKQEVDAIVNAANESLVHGAGLAAAIVKAGGKQIEEESREYIKIHKEVKVSENAVTSPGILPCSFLIHSVGPYYQEVKKNISICDLYDCITKTLTRANNELGCTSIAFPAISAGIFGFPLDLCAHTIFEALETDLSEKYNSAELGLKDIRIVFVFELQGEYELYSQWRPGERGPGQCGQGGRHHPPHPQGLSLYRSQPLAFMGSSIMFERGAPLEVRSRPQHICCGPPAKASSSSASNSPRCLHHLVPPPPGRLLLVKIQGL